MGGGQTCRGFGPDQNEKLNFTFTQVIWRTLPVICTNAQIVF